MQDDVQYSKASIEKTNRATLKSDKKLLHFYFYKLYPSYGEDAEVVRENVFLRNIFSHCNYHHIIHNAVTFRQPTATDT